MKIALSDNQKIYSKYYIELLASAINNTTPENPPDNFNWEYYIKHAQKNSVLNILSYAIEKLSVKPDESLLKVANNERFFHIIKETSQLVEVEKILKEFEKAQIKNIPLKGYYMKQLYPQSDYRTMTDIDILINKKDFSKVKKIFNDLGYFEDAIIRHTEIHFRKEMLYFEIQSNLNENEDNYFDDIWQKVSLSKDSEYSYKLNKQDFYIYMIYHCAKHFNGCGLGIRMIMDVYIYLSQAKNLDWDYINSAFEKLRIKKFANEIKNIATNWFSSEKTEITPLGEFVLYCSTFGQREIGFYRDSANTKGNYWLNQIFKPYSKMKNQYEYLNKFPFLLPISWIQYWFTRIFIFRNLNFKDGLNSRINSKNFEDKDFIDNLIKELEM